MYKEKAPQLLDLSEEAAAESNKKIENLRDGICLLSKIYHRDASELSYTDFQLYWRHESKKNGPSSTILGGRSVREIEEMNAEAIRMQKTKAVSMTAEDKQRHIEQLAAQYRGIVKPATVAKPLAEQLV